MLHVVVKHIKGTGSSYLYSLTSQELHFSGDWGSRLALVTCCEWLTSLVYTKSKTNFQVLPACVSRNSLVPRIKEDCLIASQKDKAAILAAFQKYQSSKKGSVKIPFVPSVLQEENNKIPTTMGQ